MCFCFLFFDQYTCPKTDIFFFCLFGFAFVCFVVALVFLIKDLLISFSVQLPLTFERVKLHFYGIFKQHKLSRPVLNACNQIIQDNRDV